MTNMSDGINDGIVIMYCKDGVIYPVGLNQEQLEMIDLSIGMCLQGSLNVIGNRPLGQIMNLKKK
ncbi:hypothetical protein KTC96_24845 (plasmid) [Clostridium estertheticum]|uniref:hypothetical protein n=1 Tax=Clostridium estertheticum TaxID=238834 RepID=UPI001C7D5190|nr:hypothetical protein [Clostridium estertheticum]MBX4259757.1 hypothetical protein [Clostridium estertheticum]WLC73336.1 hypothetical protein KTC96_24845 [Clostridium estertheticum]